MPRELIAPAKEQVAFHEYERPALQPLQVRVRSLFGAAKHGTEMALYRGYAATRGGYDPEYKVFTTERPGVNYPVHLGNMCVGEIIEVTPGVTKVQVGDIVFNYGSFREEHVWQEKEALLEFRGLTRKSVPSLPDRARFVEIRLRLF